MAALAPSPRRIARARATALICAAVCFGMVGVSFAAVPLYRLFCQLTGYGGTTQRAAAAPREILDRTITVRLDANVAAGLNWEFKPEVTEVELKVGEARQVAFLVKNRSDFATVGTATFNVTPDLTGAYFNKIACFCFNEQKLGPGESAELPVLFFVDPAIAKDHSLDRIDTITLSYTFFSPDAGRGGGAVAGLPAAGDRKL
ncbi:MAG: cytochrome c oxidase assembly protein [Bauldia sp.]|mgnify:CR=1 FL=1